jgi:hypothetical protein
MANKNIIQVENTTAEELLKGVEAIINNALQRINSQNNQVEISNKEDKENLLPRLKACELLHITPKTIDVWTKQGILPAYKLGHCVYYKKDEVFNMLSNNIK